MNMKTSGTYPWLMTNKPPINGIAKKASSPPVISLMIRASDMCCLRSGGYCIFYCNTFI